MYRVIQRRDFSVFKENEKEQNEEAYAKHIVNLGQDDAFMIMDLGDVLDTWKLWHQQLNIEPYYAVKSNPDRILVSTLIKLGCRFDCASKNEIFQVLSQGAKPSDIIYANSVKQTSHIQYAADNGIHVMTFDCLDELHKIKHVDPDAELILRLTPPNDSNSACPLSEKFGAQPAEAMQLLSTAAQIDMNVIGLSFHIGSGSYDLEAFPAAIASAKSVYDEAKEAGFLLSLLDIGGGFPGKNKEDLFLKHCSGIRAALKEHFPPSLGVRIIAEPGRYFATSACSVYATVICAKQISSANPTVKYYTNEGLYGALNCCIADAGCKCLPQAIICKSAGSKGTKPEPCILWGPTCDSLDRFPGEYLLPRLQHGDVLKFPNMGAYSSCMRTKFNDMGETKCYHLITQEAWDKLSALTQDDEDEDEIQELDIINNES